MRKTLLLVLAAGVSMPALAADERDDRRAAREAARAERSDDRPGPRFGRSMRAEPSPRSAPPADSHSPPSSSAPAIVQEQHREAVRHQEFERRPERARGDGPARPTFEPRVVEIAPGADETPRPALAPQVLERRAARRLRDSDFVRPPAEQSSESADSVREWRSRERRAETSPAVLEQRNSAGVFQQPREDRRGRDGIGNRRAPIVSRIAREGTQPPAPNAVRASRQSAHHWRGDWRNDRRYDWRKHRNRHRSLFRFGFYYDPFGWSYRPYSIGWRLWPSYYHSRYWLNDPGMYRLPYAPPGYRWIRYYDDALLVDTWDGQVVDVIYDFFW